MIRSLLFASCLFLGYSAQAQILSNGTGGGNWSDPGTWIGGIVPDFNSGAITIQAGDQVNVDADFTIDQTTVQATATLVIDPTFTLIIADGAGIDFTMNGTFSIEGTLVLNNTATHSGMNASNTTFVAGSEYRHLYTAAQGTIPLATWDVASTIRVVGYTNGKTLTIGSNFNQNFGDFIWDCPSQSGIISLAGLLTSTQNLTIQNTGSSTLRLSSNESPTISVAGNLSIVGASRVEFSTTGANTEVTIQGDFIVNTTVGISRFKTSGALCTVNVGGNFTMNASGATLSLSSGAGDAIMNLTGDFDLIAGTLTESGAGQGIVNFEGSGIHTFTNTGSITGGMVYTIPASETVTAIGESIIQGGSGSSITVDGTLVAESENGSGAIITGIGAGGGNLRVTTRNFNTGSTLIYRGTGAQFLGNGQPVNTGVTTIINNASGVSLNNSSSATVTIDGDVTVLNGDLTAELDNLVLNGLTTLTGGNLNLITTTATRALTSNGIINLNGGDLTVTSGTANATLTVNGDITGSGAFSFSGANNNLVLGGTGDLSIDFPLIAPTSLESVTVNRTGSIVFPQDLTVTSSLITNSGTVVMNAPLNVGNDITMNGGDLVMNSSLVIADDLNIATGSTLFFEGQTVELRSQYNNTLSGGLFSADAASTLNILNTGALGTIEFAPSGNTLGNFYLDRGTGGTLVTLNSSLNIESSFTLQNGDFLNTSGLSFTSGATITRSNLGAFSAGSIAPTGGPYNLDYVGGTLTTGAEALGAILNLTSNSSGTINVASNVAATGDITINSGNFTSGGNQISALNVSILGTFNAPTAAGLLTVSGDIVNNGTFNRNGGTVVFNGNSSILGTVNPSFNNITISGILTPPVTLNIHGAFTNNGVFNNGGTGTVAFLGTAGVTQVVSGTTVTNFANINVTNTSASPDVTIESNQNLLGVLTLANTATVDADGTSGNSVLTLISSADNPTQDASIATLPGTANVLGNVTVQRFMSIEGPNNGRIYRYISSPVQNADVAQVQNFIPVTGSFTGTSTCTGCGSNQSMFLYNENVITDVNSSGGNDADDGYSDFPVAANTETLAPGRGYAIFVRANVPPVSTSGSALWEVRAPINRGTVNYNSLVSFTSSGTLANDGWNLVGNPYPSTIDWDAATGWTRTNLTNAIYLRDNGQTLPVYATYVGGVGTNGGSRYIPMGQAYFVKSDGGAINFQSDENVKVAGTQGTFVREGAVSDVIRITLKKDNLKDETVIRFSGEATEGYDQNLDAYKLPNATFNVSSIAGSTRFAINSIPFGGCSSTVQLNISDTAPGNYQLSFTELQSFSSVPEVRLLDNFTGSSTLISNDEAYSFTVTSDPASFGNRFSVLVDQPQIDLNIMASGSQNVCKEVDYEITLASTEAGVSYYASINGTIVSDRITGSGGSLVLEVLADKLSIGGNSISIFAQRAQCTALPLSSTMNVVVDGIYEIQSVTDGVSCQTGQTTLKAIGAPSNGAYRWYDSENSTEPISETVTGEYVTPVLDKTKTYYVTAVNASGCEGNKTMVKAVVEQFDNVEITETSYGVLTSNHTAGNTWYFNNVLIAGATGQSLTVSESGLYRVEVEVGSCKTVDEFEFVVTGITETSVQSRFHPNPVTDKLYVQVAGLGIKSIQVVSNTGVSVGFVTVGSNDNEVEIDFEGKPAGLYLIKLNTIHSAVSTFKIIKQ